MSDRMQQQWQSSWLDSGHQSYLENQYEIFLSNPEQLSKDWQDFFTNLEGDPASDISIQAIRSRFKNFKSTSSIASSQTVSATHELRQVAVHDLINGFRLFGHLYASINPLATNKPTKIPELELAHYQLDNCDTSKQYDANDLAGPKIRSLQSIVEDIHKIYCGTAAAELMHIPDSEERTWIQNKYEQAFLQPNLSKEQKLRILEMVTAADGLEKYLGSKYPGAKRFGLEGCDSLIVALDNIIFAGGKKGAKEIVMGMAHRGRLNVLVNILGKMPSELFDEFEGKHSEDVESGDVKYHQGFSSDVTTEGGNVHLSLAFNPSHLEIVTPVVMGSVRSRQERRGEQNSQQVMSVIMHGDAAFSGQGVVMESLNMSQTRGYNVGGSIHIIINNQIGFTTSNPEDSRSTLYSSDLGKMLSIPIFHVNADDPEAVFMITNLAVEYKLKFNKDVIIDLVGYRRMGHNEADEPSVTQPYMYSIIKKHLSVREIYAKKLVEQNICDQEQTNNLRDAYRERLDKRDQAVVNNLSSDAEWKQSFTTYWAPYDARDWRIPADTGVKIETIKQLAEARDKIPDNFKLHPRVEKIINDRRQMTAGEHPIDWGYAETLAYATLLNEGYGVRLSGQDCGRGTFFHRHAVWHNQLNSDTYVSLYNLSEKQGKCWIIDSLLSELGVLGFEYGYSTSEPRTLTIWEAQFGDFANGAQIVIDQFISSGEHKWGRLSGLVLLLPHGYEGQGPEHSSARLERYLQLCAEHNIQVCVPSTPAQVFHMLRRQMIRPVRKPLIAITPKSLLRHKRAVSTLEDLSKGEFQPVIGGNATDHAQIKKVVLCSGKIYYELLDYQEKNQIDDTDIIRIEQLYPFPEDELKAKIIAYPNLNSVVWCQEEPQNQGAWYSSQHHIKHCLSESQKLSYAGREASASPAVGYHHLHNQQQEGLVKAAFSKET